MTRWPNVNANVMFEQDLASGAVVERGWEMYSEMILRDVPGRDLEQHRLTFAAGALHLYGILRRMYAMAEGDPNSDKITLEFLQGINRELSVMGEELALRHGRVAGHG